MNKQNNINNIKSFICDTHISPSSGGDVSTGRPAALGGVGAAKNAKRREGKKSEVMMNKFKLFSDEEKEVFVCVSMAGYDLGNFYGNLMSEKHIKAIGKLINQGIITEVCKSESIFETAIEKGMLTLMQVGDKGMWLCPTQKGDDIFFAALLEDGHAFSGYKYLQTAETIKKDQIFRDAIKDVIHMAVSKYPDISQTVNNLLGICNCTKNKKEPQRETDVSHS